MHYIFFDLEGPLSPQDNAYDVLGLAENGNKVFEVLSKYDDILTMEGRANYEPGDTLKLIVPFLIFHNISDEDIRKVSKRARVVSGAREMIAGLKSQGWEVFIISTSYQQHAYNIAWQVGVDKERVACTKMPINDYISDMGKEDFALVEKMEKKILTELYPGNDESRVVKTLDDFFFKKLQNTRLGRIFNEVTIVGGQRKVDALKRFLPHDDFTQVAAVGDSITDYKMLGEVREKGGLAVAFNGNSYSIPYANVALASVDQRFFLPIADAFKRKGKAEAVTLCKGLEKSDFKNILERLPSENAKDVRETKPPRYHSLDSMDKKKIEEIVKIHKEYRMLVRGAAGKLG